ncbi:MAG: hypothetical protein MUE96_00225 [Bacteroidia bacterium]|jgi:hypothetical protein|nr:hypothetical protein [Bacteroidia bacterium]
MTATLLNDGDNFEKHYWTQFMSTDFPSYESYWTKHIVPMTNRPTNIHFKNSKKLTAAGFTAEDICKAQLHYTTFRHLVRAFEIRNALSGKTQSVLDTDLLSEGLFHIVAAQDVAFEFLQRIAEPNQFDPWASNKKTSTTNSPGSKQAQDKWKNNNGHPLKDIRDYRNHLAHGRMSPSIQSPPKVLIPKISFENAYLDWRLVTDWNSTTNASDQADFDSLDNILTDAWKRTIQYLETEWKKII